MRKTRKYISYVAIWKFERKVCKASHCGGKQQCRSPDKITPFFLVHATYIRVLLVAHIPFMVNRTFNIILTERLQQRPLLFAMNHTTLLRLKSLSNKFAKLRTMAASNKRDTGCALSISACSHHRCCILVLFFTRISFVVNGWIAHAT